MEVYRISCRPFLFLGILCLAATLQAVQGGAESEGPSESECRPYIEKALRELETAETADQKSPPDESEEQPSEEAEPSTAEVTIDDSDHERSDDRADTDEAEGESREEDKESVEGESAEVEDNSDETTDSKETEQEDDVNEEQKSAEDAKVDDDEVESAEEEEAVGEIKEAEESEEEEQLETEEPGQSDEETQEIEEQEDASSETTEEAQQDEADDDAEGENEQSSETELTPDEDAKSQEETSGEVQSAEEESKEDEAAAVSEEEEKPSQESTEAQDDASQEETSRETDKESAEQIEEEQDGASEEARDESTEAPQDATDEASTESKEDDAAENEQPTVDNEEGGATSDEDEHDREKRHVEAEGDIVEKENESQEVITELEENASKEEEQEASKDESKESKEEAVETEDAPAAAESAESQGEASDKEALDETAGNDDEDKTEEEADEQEDDEEKETLPEEELVNEGEIPDDLRPTEHIRQLLKLDEEHSQTEKLVNNIADITLRDLKKLYENAIKPLETLYKYRDLSNRHYGDAEIFSKPLVLFMGPWSGGKSSIINYLIENEYSETSLRTGAEPSPAYFNILMYGEEPEILDGTQLAADFTFSGLQKFGQGLEERLRGTKLPLKLLQKINIVEIPGILEVRKQISRVFPFNDACQWFIDRADIIYLIYDPSKLDVGPETEAILDQLKGREHQTRIILNKADQVKPEELMRVQGALIWNISPLMSSAQPPIMYTTSLWSRPYEIGAPVRLLQAQERAFLRDLRTAVDKRIENKIASARRFAVRVRNHAKMVDCYLTTYYNHKSVFGNRKQVSDAIIEHPQDYHIYEGLSTLTNISRYDLPDPDVYRDFFRLNALYEFQQLSATCTYFRGCPINRLDVAIAYDLPELVGKHKRMVETALSEAGLSRTPGS